MSKRWAVGNVHTGDEVGRDPSTGAETGVAVRLRKLGIEVYCPSFETAARKWRRRRPKPRVRAVFPGYLFVNPETIDNMEAVYEVEGFHYFLRYPSGDLKCVPDSAIAGMRELEAKGIILPTSLEALLGKFNVGDEVRVNEGALSGLHGIVREIKKDRAKVYVEGMYLATLPIDSLEAKAS